MKIITNNYALTALDGTIVLRFTVDRPQENISTISSYLCDYSNRIETFVRNTLYSTILDRYASFKSRGDRFLAFTYLFRIVCTCEQDDKSSYLMASHLYQGSYNLVTQLDSVIVYQNLFVPQRLITKTVRANSALVLNCDGKPCWAETINGMLQYIPAEKRRTKILQ